MSKPVRKPLPRSRIETIRERIEDPIYLEKAIEKISEGLSSYFVKEKMDINVDAERK